jgi:6-phosphofructokinase 1
MGRDSGYLAFYAGVATGAEQIIIPGENVDYENLATMISERDRDSRIIVAEGYDKKVEEIREILEQIFIRRSIKHEIRTVDMGYFQRGGKAATKDILTASWLGYKMVKDAFDKKDSGFYAAYNAGQEPTILPLELAVQDKVVNHDDLPNDLLEFAVALR